MRALREVCPLSERQYEVVALMMQGRDYGEIAHELKINVSTIRTHIHSAYERLGLAGSSRGALFAVMLSRGWITPAEVAPQDAYSTWLQATRNDLDWQPSAAQRCYLKAFDRLLVRRDAASAAAMEFAYRLMCWEAGIPMRTWPDIERCDEDATDRVDEMLLGMARALTRPIPLAGAA